MIESTAYVNIDASQWLMIKVSCGLKITFYNLAVELHLLECCVMFRKAVKGVNGIQNSKLSIIYLS